MEEDGTHWMKTVSGSRASRPLSGSTKPEPRPRSRTRAPVSCWMWWTYDPWQHVQTCIFTNFRGSRFQR